MKGDFSRDTFVPRKHYKDVRMQQGRVQLDADWNEQHALVSYRIETETQDLVGHCGGPIDGAGFDVVTDASKLSAEDAARLTKLKLLPLKAGDFLLSAGRYYVDGLLCENDAVLPCSSQPDWPGAAALDPTTKGIYLLYLDVWERHLTWLDDPQIREIALGGPDTATRTKTIWQAKLLQVADDPKAKADCLSSFKSYDDLTKPSDGTLSAQADPATIPTDPCIVPPVAGYRGLENQLYRVEIHQGSGAGTPTFKWSRDNGSVVTEIRRINGKEITVNGLGPDKALGFEAGQWVEISDDWNDLQGTPGQLAFIDKVDPAGGIITVKVAPTPLVAGAPGVAPAFHPKLRRWDQTGTEAKATGVKTNTTWIELENGVQVKFSSGTYQTGDYWLIPARTANAANMPGTIEWPQEANQPQALTPRGIRHHFCRLALLRWDGKTIKASDCRCLFPRLTEMTDLFYVSGDGQEAMPDLLQPAKLVTLAQPLVVGVANAHCRDKKVKMRFRVTIGDGKIMPPGGAPVGDGKTADILTDDDGLASCEWQLDPVLRHQQVEARRLDDNDQPLYLPIRFNANLSVADQVSYDPQACDGMKEQVTVQQAIDRLAQFVSLFHVQGGGQDIAPGEPLEELRVLAANKCGPIAGVKVRFTVLDGSGTVDGVNPSTPDILTHANGIAKCVWVPDSTTDFQQVEAIISKSDPHPLAAPTSVRFTVNLRKDGQGGCCVTVGAGGQFQRLDEAIKELAKQKQEDICICLLPGEHPLDKGLVIKGRVKVKIEGCGRGSRLLIKNKQLVVTGLESFLLRDVTVLVEDVADSIVITECFEVGIFNCYLRQVSQASTTLLTIGQSSRIRLHDNFLESWLTWEDPCGLCVRTIPNLRFPELSLFPTTERLSAALQEVAEVLANTDAATRAEVSKHVEDFMANQNNRLWAETEARFRESAQAIRTSREQFRDINLFIAFLKKALIPLFFPAAALAITDGLGDVEIENNLLIGSLRFYGAGGPLPGNELLSLAKRIRDNAIILTNLAGNLQIRGNRLFSLEIDRDILKQIIVNERLPNMFRRCCFSDNAISVNFSQNVLLADNLAFTSNRFNDGFEGTTNACLAIGRSATFVANSAPESKSTLHFAVRTAAANVQLVANLLNIQPLP